MGSPPVPFTSKCLVEILHIAWETSVLIAGPHGPVGQADRAVRAVTRDTQVTAGAQDRHLIWGRV